MLNWIRRVFHSPVRLDRQTFVDQLEAMNVAAAGGKPLLVERNAGRLTFPSRVLVLDDPQGLPHGEGNRFSGLAADEAEITVTLWRYPNGYEKCVGVRLQFGECPLNPTRRAIGKLGIDSAKVVVADQDDLKRHWTEVGPDRIGRISTARDDTVKRLLTKRFGLKTRQVNGITAEVVTRVSSELEAEIEAFLKSDPRYSAFPFMHFHVQTNNSFDRVNYFDAPYGFLPIGSEPTPVLFTCGTGHGDGLYTVHGAFEGERLCAVAVDFLEDDL